MTAQQANVAVSVDFDAIALWRNFGATGARSQSRGEFDVNVGAPRLLALFDRLSIPTSWFIPGHTVETWPAVTRDVHAAGHEIGNHGYYHESFDELDADEAIATVRRANRAIEAVAGVRPRGMRVPGGDLHGDLFEQLVAEGFDYDSSLLGGDFYPVWCRARDRHPDGPTVFGERLDLVEIPIGFLTNDWNHFEFNYSAPTFTGSSTPSMVEEIWRSQFDYMYRHCPGGSLIVTLHPQCIGQGGRMLMLERFLDYCRSHPGVRFVRHDTIVDEFRASQSNVES